jgi:Spy/CpxP family protein refolding chaperone
VCGSVPALSRTCRPGQTDVKNRWKSLTRQRKLIPLRFPFIILGLLLAVGNLSAKDPPQRAPTPDPALELSPAQDQQIQRINNLFAQNEKPWSDALKKAREEYKRAKNAHPVDEEMLRETAAAAQRAATLLATAQALHRANVLILLTPAQRRMVETLELTGKVPGNEGDKKSRDLGQ